MSSIFHVFKKAFDIKSRSSRSEFWMFTLKIFLIVMSLDLFTFVMIGSGQNSFASIVCIFSFIPWVSLLIRRLNDAGLSRWWSVLAFIPFFGQIIVMAMACKGSAGRELMQVALQSKKTDLVLPESAKKYR